MQNILEIAIFKYASQFRKEVNSFNFLDNLRKIPGKFIEQLPFILRRLILKLYIISKHDSSDTIYSYHSKENHALNRSGYIDLEGKRVLERDLQEVSQFIINSSQSI
jgi:hypothetical protein